MISPEYSPRSLINHNIDPITRTCPGDEKSYQTCGLSTDIAVMDSTTMLCSAIPCEIRTDGSMPEEDDTRSYVLHLTQFCGSGSGDMFRRHFDCMPRLTDDECDGLLKKLHRRTNVVHDCDVICQDESDCSDEALCNGRLYGMFCTKNGQRKYVSTYQVCDQITDCDDRSDEVSCTNGRDQSDADMMDACYRSMENSGMPIELRNNTRCGPLRYGQFGATHSLCIGFIDQMNCSDPDRGVLNCTHSGFPATVSRAVLCVPGASLCDDKLDSQCTRLSSRCTVHKHLLCNGVEDCTDGRDEINPHCHAVLEQKCFRRYWHSEELAIPVSWLSDGIVDCESGVDETTWIWPTCRLSHDRLRRVVDNTTCPNVFICKQGSLDYIELTSLCDGTEDCGEERSVCRHSRKAPHIFVTTVRQGDADSHLLHCLPGLASVERLCREPCQRETFLTPDSHVHGVTPIRLSLPLSAVDCSTAHGELYVFLSCTGKCANSPCPLASLRSESCTEGRVKTLFSMSSGDMYITKVTKGLRGNFHNRLFSCKNKQCLPYDKVCNLVDDCGDSSDEDGCTNSFQCISSGVFIPREKRCDGTIDCIDFSDECNAECSKQIIEGSFFKGLTWIIGVVAVVMNSVSLRRGFTEKWVSKKVAMVNRVFKILISIGDLMTGVYLLLIALVDTVFGNGSYCKNQLSWLTSDLCILIGVINSVGTSLSLFSMTYLSIFRVLNVQALGGVKSRYLPLKVTMIAISITIASTAIACFPVISKFEDFFVNGIAYRDMSLFVGPADKSRHLAVLRAYYGKMSRRRDLTWREIRRLLDLMFTREYGNIDGRKIHFYGNEGVCLFKYFVRRNDPQNMYVWAILFIDLSCFFIITCCYVVLNVKVKRNGRGLQELMARLGNKRMGKLEIGNRRLQKSITRIIVTDFICWIPFLVICVLHSTSVIDATFLYSFSSIVILPINSIINPLIYDDFMFKWLRRMKNHVLPIWYGTEPLDVKSSHQTKVEQN